MRVSALAVVGLAAFAQTTFAQSSDTAEDVFLLQLKRFEGTFACGKKNLPCAALLIRPMSHGSEIVLTGPVEGKNLEIHIRSFYDPSQHLKLASIDLDGRTWNGTSAIDGMDLIVEAKQGTECRRLRLHLDGRSTASFCLTRQDGADVESPVVDILGTRQ